MVNWERKCFKTLFFISNLILLLISVALVFGVMALVVSGKEIIDLMGKFAFPVVACGLVIFTTEILLLLLLSYCGTKRNSACILRMYVILVVITVCGLIAATFFAWLFRDVIVEAVRAEMEITIKEYVTHDNNDLTNAWDTLQQYIECCGIDDLGDWARMNPSYMGVYGNKYPFSCQPQDGETRMNFADGCLLKVKEIINANHWPIGGGIAAIIFYLMSSAMIACALSRSLGSRDLNSMHPMDPGLVLNGVSSHSTMMSTNSRTPITSYS